MFKVYARQIEIESSVFSKISVSGNTNTSDLKSVGAIFDMTGYNMKFNNVFAYNVDAY